MWGGSVKAKCTSDFGAHLYIFCHFLENKSTNISVMLKNQIALIFFFTFYDGLRSVFRSILYNFLLWLWRKHCRCLLFQFRAKNQITNVNTLSANISFIRGYAILYISSHVNKAGIHVWYKTHLNKALSANKQLLYGVWPDTRSCISENECIVLA